MGTESILAELWEQPQFRRFIQDYYADKLKLAHTIALHNGFAVDNHVTLEIFKKLASPAYCLTSEFTLWKMKQQGKKAQEVIA